MLAHPAYIGLILIFFNGISNKKATQDKKNEMREKLERMAGSTGLEPATPGSTVRYSNQLSYEPAPRRNDASF